MLFQVKVIKKDNFVKVGEVLDVYGVTAIGSYGGYFVCFNNLHNSFVPVSILCCEPV